MSEFKRIGIDCRLAGQQHAGIGRYVENLITRLPASIPDRSGLQQPITWVLFFHDKAQADAIQTSWPANTELRFAPIKHYTLSEQLKMPGIFQSAKLSLLHVPHFNVAWGYTGKTVITIHDLLWHEQRGSQVTTLKPWTYWLKYGLYLLTVHLAVNRAKVIFVPAETIKETVTRHYPDVAPKIIVTPEGLGEVYADTAKNLLKTGQLPKSKDSSKSGQLNLVYTGSLYPHKNLGLVLKAIQLHANWSLTLVGVRSVFQAQINRQITQLKLEDQVKIAGYLTDHQLVELYQKSHALIQPSLSEGFGLTGIEAMAAGSLVLASDIQIFHEIYQSAAIFFNPKSVSHLEIAIEYLAKLSAKQKRERQETGLKLSLNYRWSEMVKKTTNYYFSPEHY